MKVLEVNANRLTFQTSICTITVNWTGKSFVCYNIYCNTLSRSAPVNTNNFCTGLNIFYSSQDMIKGSGRAKSHV